MPFLPQVASENLEHAIFRTVAFFDCLDFCLTDSEIYDRLLGFSATFDEVALALPLCSRVVQTRGYYHLAGRDTLVSSRELSSFHHAQLMRKTYRLAWLFRCIPFLSAVYLCNTLAMTHGKPGSDIDIFVVSKSGRIFFVRFFLHIFLHVFRLRRHGSHIASRFCLSFFVDDRHLQLEPLLLAPHDPYFAYWFLLLRPLYLRDRLGFLADNPWLHSYFSTPTIHDEVSFSRPYFFARCIEYVFSGSLGHWIESLFSQWQLRRARKKYDALGKPPGVFLSSYCLKFHDQDRRKVYRDRFESIIRP